MKRLTYFYSQIIRLERLTTFALISTVFKVKPTPCIVALMTPFG